jgi:glutathionylspermidine synthase
MHMRAFKISSVQGGAAGDLEHHKCVYRVLWGQMQQEKSELKRSTEAFTQLKAQLMERFSLWYKEQYNVQLSMAVDQKTAVVDANGGG